MEIQIGNWDYTEVWDGVFYKKLAAYPVISAWELRNIAEFAKYENIYGRECIACCEDATVLRAVQAAIKNPDEYLQVKPPEIIRECRACLHQGCLTKWVCHTASPENAAKILACGKLLSAVGARKMPAEALMKEPRNAAHDPADYFHYVMLSWGNCQAGDRLVMERKLGRFPDEADLSTGFTPGVRFYFRYNHLAQHPGVTYDGVLPMKIKDEIVLRDWVDCIVVPMALKRLLAPHIPEQLLDKTIFIENDCRDIWEWSKKVYETVESTAS